MGMGIEEKIIYLPLKAIKPYKKNPRKNDKAVEFVANSIRQFGFRNPIIIDENYEIVCGHTRWKAAKVIGLEFVPCIMADDLNEDQIRAFRLADNKTAEMADWDFDLLEMEFNDIDPELFDMSDFGFFQDDETEDKAPTEVTEDDFDETAVTESVCKRGQVWQLGEHRLMCGDSTSAEDVARLMGGEKADMVFTDPPYGMGLDTDYSDMKSNLKLASDRGILRGNYYDADKVDSFSPEMIKAIMDIDAKETFIWGADYFAELLPDKNSGSWIVWDKRLDESADKMYGSCFELCWSKNKHKREMARIKWAGLFGTEQEFDHCRNHPTQKPAKLSAWFFERYGKTGDIVLDLFGSSGSTLIACEQLGRKCFMMEISPHYCDVIIRRWENLTGQKAKLVEE